jgi:hypothetical protein
MIWGFPLQLKGKHGQPLKPKPVNNTRADKLGSNFWYNSFEQRRCLIPLTAWAEAEGPTRAKTRTWLSLMGYPKQAAACSLRLAGNAVRPMTAIACANSSPISAWTGGRPLRTGADQSAAITGRISPRAKFNWQMDHL